MTFKYLNLPFSLIFLSVHPTLQSNLYLLTPQICPELPDSGAPLMLFTSAGVVFPVLWLSKAYPSSQVLSRLIFSLISPLSPPEIMYSFSKFMHDSVLLCNQLLDYAEMYTCLIFLLYGKLSEDRNHILSNSVVSTVWYEIGT